MKQFASDSGSSGSTSTLQRSLASSNRTGSRKGVGSSSGAPAAVAGRPNTTPITSIRVVSRGGVGGLTSLSASGFGQLVPLGVASPGQHKGGHHDDFLHEDIDDDVMLADDDDVVCVRGGGGSGRTRQTSETYERDDDFCEDNDDDANEAHLHKHRVVTPISNRQGPPPLLSEPGGINSSAVEEAATPHPHAAPQKTTVRRNSKDAAQKPAAAGGAKKRATGSHGSRRPVTAPEGSPEPSSSKKKEPTTTAAVVPPTSHSKLSQPPPPAQQSVPPPQPNRHPSTGSKGAKEAKKSSSSHVPNGSTVTAAVVPQPNGQQAKRRATGDNDTSVAPSSKENPSMIQPLRVKVAHKAVIGKGSFGVVYQAMNLDTNHIVACKEICLVNKGAGASSSADQVTQIKKELAMLKQLDHPNIVKCLGEDCDDKFLRIYMEYVTGGSMSSVLKMFGALQEKQASIFTEQMLQGLAYLHDRHICHRDLKGDNLLIDTHGVLKLADFGTAKELASQAASTVAGTAYFMAPEVIQGVGHGVEADVWSAGCCVIEMLTSKPPFFHLKNQYAIMMHVAENSRSLDDVFPSAVSADCASFLRRCLVRNPHDRATVQELLQHPWIQSPPEPQRRLSTTTNSDGATTASQLSSTADAPLGGMLDTASIHLAGQQSIREAQETVQRERRRQLQLHQNGGTEDRPAAVVEGGGNVAVSSFNPMDLINDDDEDEGDQMMMV